MKTTAADLIARSQSHNEIVHTTNQDLRDDLVAECDEWTEIGRDGAEYWGSNDRGEWRVHLDSVEIYDTDRADYDV